MFGCATVLVLDGILQSHEGVLQSCLPPFEKTFAGRNARTRPSVFLGRMERARLRRKSHVNKLETNGEDRAYAWG